MTAKILTWAIVSVVIVLCLIAIVREFRNLRGK